MVFSTFHVNMISNLFPTTTKPTVFDEFVDDFSEVCGGDQPFFDVCGFHGRCKHVDGVREFSKQFSFGSAVESFELQKLFQLDDMEHFEKRVQTEFQLDLYDAADSNKRAINFMQLGDVSVLQPCGTVQNVCNFWQTHLEKSATCGRSSKPCQDHLDECGTLETFWSGCENHLTVRAVTSCKHVDIILDSGSDVTLIPMHMSGIGTKSQVCPGTYLRDAQGKEITTSDVRDVSFAFETLDGETVTIKERAFFSDRVECPLISFGKLLKTGWGIESSNMSGPPTLSHKSGAKVELAFRNNSLVLAGDVRLIQDVRVISVDVPRTWFNLPKGWYSLNGFQICSSSATHFIDATAKYLVTEWPYRTTVAYHDTHGWQVIELCEKLFSMDERAGPITGNYARLLTVLSKDVLTVSQFGMVISDAVRTPKVMDLQLHRVQLVVQVAVQMLSLLQVFPTCHNNLLQFQCNSVNKWMCRWKELHCLRLLQWNRIDQWSKLQVLKFCGTLQFQCSKLLVHFCK